jgi:hypothetical protein
MHLEERTKINNEQLDCYYPNVQFLSSKYLDSPYNTRYQICYYCSKYKKMHILNYPVYYRKGARRSLFHVVEIVVSILLLEIFT